MTSLRAGARSPYATPETIGAVLARQAATIGDAPALKELNYDGAIGRVWTYNELFADAERLARALASRHAKGARIAVWANNIPEWMLLEFASAMAGLTLVTVNPAFQARELKFVLDQSKSEALYYIREFRGNPMAKIAAEVAIVGVPDEKWGEQVACFMRVKGAERPAPAELKAFVRARLSPQKTPAYWIFVEEWPLTGSGKIQRFKLAEAFARGDCDIVTA